MIRPPPSSPLFPYTTPSDLRRSAARSSRRLERSRPRLASDADAQGGPAPLRFDRREQLVDLPHDFGERRARSEEHTSELQSHSDLVCRLLLEKKKNEHNDTV